jgi:L-seryl-tRNA(Ser) seleniumtransferase
MSDLRLLPSVDQLLNTPLIEDHISAYGRSLTLQAIRSVLDEVRIDYITSESIPSQDALLNQIQHKLTAWTTPTLQQVINATGVILHTNLGRAPLSQAALKSIQETASGYSTLEYELDKGRRGSREVHAGDLLKRITGAEAALVVNNNASAVLLILSALAKRRKVCIARSQLVEIGGGFRIPDVMKQSGAKLFEIGTTNRVHLYDYERAIQEESIRLVMRVHRSNFQILGFTSEPPLSDIVTVAHQGDIPVIDDLGSGTLLETNQFGLGHEPMVQESLAAGVDLVCFSGDKLLGGPQAGIILGKSDLITKLKKHPLARAIRPDKLCLGALSATLLHYLKDEALLAIPVWRMISEPVEQIKQRADQWVAHLDQGVVVEGRSTVGGGSLPGETLPTWLVAINDRHPNQLLSKLRQSSPPIIARLEDDQIMLDPRTVLDEQEAQLLTNLNNILNH